MIVINAVSGLANRICNIVSGAILADLYGVPWQVIWLLKPKVCGARYEELFETTENSPTVVSDVSRLENFLRDPTLRPWRNRKRMEQVEFLGNKPPAGLRHRPVVIPARELGFHDLFIECCFNYRIPTMTEDDFFVRCAAKINALFMPRRDILSQILDMPRGTVGIHIRQGDKLLGSANRIYRLASRVDKLTRYMADVLLQAPDQKFFVCTDSPGAKRTMRERFGSAIITYDTPVLDRDSLDGMREAVRDLYTLGQTRMIIGDGDSSYGPVAARYRNVDYVNLTSRGRGYPQRLLVHGLRKLRLIG